MCAIAKWFFGRCAAATKRHPFFHRKLVAVGVDQFHFARHDVRAVLDCFDCYVSHGGNTKAANPKSQAPEKHVRQDSGNSGEQTRLRLPWRARLTIANFSEIASAGCRNQHAGGVCSPERRLHALLLDESLPAHENLCRDSCFACHLCFRANAVAIGKHPFTFEDMMKLKRVGAPVPSADGKWVVFDCVDVDLEANTKISHLWIVSATGGESRRLNPTPNHEERPRFSPDGKRLIWTSKATDPTQIWMCDFDSGSGVLVGKPHQVTEISTGADGGIWSPDGKNIVFVSAVYPDCKDDACNKQRDEELKKSKVKAKIFAKLFYRHWNAFTEFKRSHLFVISADCRGARAGRRKWRLRPARPPLQARDLTPGDHDVPPFSLGGQDMYAISPDGQEVAYTSNIDEVEATSTNNEIFVVPISGGTPKKISTSPGADTTPLYSPDGKYLAWRSQAARRVRSR